MQGRHVGECMTLLGVKGLPAPLVKMCEVRKMLVGELVSDFKVVDVKCDGYLLTLLV